MNDSRLSDSIFGDDGEHAQESAAPESGDESTDTPLAVTDDRHELRTERKRPMSRGRAGTSCLMLLLLMVVALGGGGYALSRAVGKIGPLGGSDAAVDMPDYTGGGSGSIDVTVNPGDSGLTIGKNLVAAGVVKSARTFSALAGADPRFSKIQPGTYHMRHMMSSAAAIDLLLSPSSRVSGGVVIREGLWSSEIFQILSKATGTPVANYQKVDTTKIDLPAAANGHLEGYLFPATYTFAKGATAEQQLKTMVDQGNQVRSTLNIPTNQLQAVMTTASIVQAEAGAADMGKVARVIDNRLKPGNTETNGKLQMDSTIHFILKKRGTSKVSLEETKIDSPYNTYLHAGLPPTPINNPGLAAIKAAQNPTPGTWYYFVTVNMDTGETLFANTLGEQQANEAKYHQWCNSHPGRC